MYPFARLKHIFMSHPRNVKTGKVHKHHSSMYPSLQKDKEIRQYGVSLKIELAVKNLAHKM